MSMFDIRVGGRLDVFDDTDYTTNQAVPRVGTIQYDPEYNAFFKFMKNLGASTLSPKMVAVATTTDKSANACRLAAATASLQTFAGVRVPGASDVPQNSYGWFQISGNATFLSDGATTTTADVGLNTSSGTAGDVIAAPNTAAGAQGMFAVAEATVNSLGADVKARITTPAF